MAIARGRSPLIASGTIMLLLAGVLIKQRSGPPENAGSDAGQSSAPEQPNRLQRRNPVSDERIAGSGLRDFPELPAPITSPHPPESPENQEWIAKRITELEALAWFEDSGSLGKIVAELRNPQPEIRAAALEATREFGSRDAIPYLEAISRTADDLLEQRAIADLVEFLKLPTLLEISDYDAIE